MPKYLMEVTGWVEVEAPNVAQAWKYATTVHDLHGKKFPVVTVSAGSMEHCYTEHELSRNVNGSDYMVSVKVVPESLSIKYLGRTEQFKDGV